MIQRQQVGKQYAKPVYKPGIGNLLRQALYRLGFDPLTVRERLTQTEVERAAWENTCRELQDQRGRTGCDLVA